MDSETRIVNPETGGAKGRKLARFDLLPWEAIWKVAEHYGRGANKYDDHNWRRGYDWSLSLGALGRHYAQFAAGEDYDEQTGSHHMAAVAFHALTLLVYADEHPDLDDRWQTRQAVELIEQDVASNLERAMASHPSNPHLRLVE